MLQDKRRRAHFPSRREWPFSLGFVLQNHAQRDSRSGQFAVCPSAFGALRARHRILPDRRAWARLCGTRLVQFTGEDATTAAYRAMGGSGCVSVTANVVTALLCGPVRCMGQTWSRRSHRIRDNNARSVAGHAEHQGGRTADARIRAVRGPRRLGSLALVRLLRARRFHTVYVRNVQHECIRPDNAL